MGATAAATRGKSRAIARRPPLRHAWPPPCSSLPVPVRGLYHETMSRFTRASSLACAFLVHLGPLGGARLRGEEGRTLSLLAHHGYLSGMPIFVRCELRGPDGGIAREVWDAEAALGAEIPGVTLEPDRISLTNGIGSAMVQITAPPGTERIPLLLSLDGLEARREIEDLDGAPQTT